jgi:hypothetical protein
MAEIPAIESPTFQPAMRIVTAITKANPASVTTSFDHDYVTGAIVSFRIPDGFGMHQINKKIGTLTVTGDTTFTVNIDSTDFDAFAVPMDNTQFAQVIPVGEINAVWTSAVENVL